MNVDQRLVFTPVVRAGLHVEAQLPDMRSALVLLGIRHLDPAQAMKELETHPASLQHLIQRREHHITHAAAHTPEQRTAIGKEHAERATQRDTRGQPRFLHIPILVGECQIIDAAHEPAVQRTGTGAVECQPLPPVVLVEGIKSAWIEQQIFPHHAAHGRQDDIDHMPDAAQLLIVSDHPIHLALRDAREPLDDPQRHVLTGRKHHQLRILMHHGAQQLAGFDGGGDRGQLAVTEQTIHRSGNAVRRKLYVDAEHRRSDLLVCRRLVTLRLQLHRRPQQLHDQLQGALHVLGNREASATARIPGLTVARRETCEALAAVVLISGSAATAGSVPAEAARLDSDIESAEAEGPSDDRRRPRRPRFGRLFPNLEALRLDDEVLFAIGSPSDDTQNPAFMEDSQFRGTDNNAEQEVGYTYFGQILTHDISLDADSVLGRDNDPSRIPNRATPWLDLDTIYRHDGTNAPRDREDRAKLLLGNDIGNERDFAREADGRARIADRRNDENNNVAQLSAMLIAFHNQMVDDIRATGYRGSDRAVFRRAKRLTIQHWQAAVLTQFLPEFVDPEVLDTTIAEGPRFYSMRDARRGIVPVEFSVAANRFGHSNARGRYTLNEEFDRVRMFPLDESELERNLLGNRPIPTERQIEWERFFDFNSFRGDFGDDEDQFAGLQVGRKVDRFLARPMLRLPIGGPGLPDFILDTENTVAGMPVVSLANISLFRGQALGLPSGQDVAVAMGIEPIDNLSLGLCNPGVECPFGDLPLETELDEAPLLLYVLEEARLQHEGEQLGEVGGRIIADVVIGLLLADRQSVLNKPFVSPVTGTSEVTMEDMLLHVGWVELPEEP